MSEDWNWNYWGEDEIDEIIESVDLDEIIEIDQDEIDAWNDDDIDEMVDIVAQEQIDARFWEVIGGSGVDMIAAPWNARTSDFLGNNN
jgi:hypothetical protein